MAAEKSGKKQAAAITLRSHGIYIRRGQDKLVQILTAAYKNGKSPPDKKET